MPWSNSWSGSGGIVADSVQVDNGGTVVASINSQGVGAFSELTDAGDATVNGNLNLAGKLLVAGQDVLSLIGNLPQGVVAWGQHFDAGTNWGLGIQGPFALASFTAEAYRVYAVYAVGLEEDSSIAGAGIENIFTYTTDGSTPTTSSPVCAGGRGNIGYGKSTWSDTSPNVVGWITFAATTAVKVGMFAGIVDGNSADVTTWASYSTGWLFWIEDKGVPSSSQGAQVSFNSVPPPPPPTKYQFQVITTASSSYTGSGPASDGSGSAGEWMYYGEDPGYAPNGNWRSYCWFDGEPGILDMAGYSSVSDLSLYVYEDWSYPIAGNTIYIGFHNHAGVPGSEPPGSTYQVLSFNVTGRGQGQWVSLLGSSAIMNAVHAGAIRGFVLGPGPNTSYDYYGYASGVNGYSPITLRATYYK